jgi:hypothetical protein
VAWRDAKAKAAQPVTNPDAEREPEPLTFTEILERSRGEDREARIAVRAAVARISSTPEFTAREPETEHERREAQRFGRTLESWRKAKLSATLNAVWVHHRAAADAGGYTPEAWIAATHEERKLAIAVYDAKFQQAAIAAEEEAARRKAEVDAKAEAARRARTDDASRDVLARGIRAGDGRSYELWFVAWAHVEGLEPMRTEGDGPDFGVDVVVTENGEKVAVQCKNYASPVGVSAVQEVIAGMRMYDCARGWVVATSVFTRQAQLLAKANDVKLLTLVPDNYIRGAYGNGWNDEMAGMGEVDDHRW